MKHPDIRVTIKKDEDNALILLKDLQAIAKSENVLYQAYDNFRISLSQKVAPTENLEVILVFKSVYYYLIFIGYAFNI